MTVWAIQHLVTSVKIHFKILNSLHYDASHLLDVIS